MAIIMIPVIFVRHLVVKQKYILKKAQSCVFL